VEPVQARHLQVEVWRGTEQGSFVAYQVPARDNQTVLDVVTWIQRHREPALAYRFACRVGMCGSCAMTVNGAARWTCRTHVSKVAGEGRLRIEPLRNLPRIKDLVCDLAPFFDKWMASGRFAGARDRRVEPARVEPQSPARRAVDAGIECINCAVCYSACDVVAWDKSYLGPAALNRAWTLLNDERHQAKPELLAQVSASSGCYRCHTLGNCAAACPVEINPTASIAGLKRATLLGSRSARSPLAGSGWRAKQAR
jgi:fumarate reductase iron-sulfur subunit